jgi:hypothetical protein
LWPLPELAAEALPRAFAAAMPERMRSWNQFPEPSDPGDDRRHHAAVLRRRIEGQAAHCDD